MLKLLFISLSIFLLSGCATLQNTPQVKKSVNSVKNVKKVKSVKKVKVKQHQMFQTVAKKDAILLQKGKAKEHCAVCGMNLVMFYKTNHAATDSNGTVRQYCSLHCLTNDLRHGAELQNPKVVDVSSLKFIPVQEAYYVVGSKKHGTMSHVSKYAFKSLADAKKFQAKNGGDIVDFYSAWQLAKKDFK